MSSRKKDTWYLCAFKKCTKIFPVKKQLGAHKKTHASIRKRKSKFPLDSLRDTVSRAAPPPDTPEVSKTGTNNGLNELNVQGPEITSSSSEDPNTSPPGPQLFNTPEISSTKSNKAVKIELEIPELELEHERTCQICFQIFAKRKFLRRHLILVHSPSNNQQKCTCKPCSFCASKSKSGNDEDN